MISMISMQTWNEYDYEYAYAYANALQHNSTYNLLNTSLIIKDFKCIFIHIFQSSQWDPKNVAALEV